MHKIDYIWTHYDIEDFEPKDYYKISDIFSYYPSIFLYLIYIIIESMENILKKLNFKVAKKC